MVDFGAQARRLVGRRRMSRTGRWTRRPLSQRGLGSGGPPPLVAVIGEYELSPFLEFRVCFVKVSLLPRPPSPSKRQAVSSVVTPAASTPAAPTESGGSGSTRGQSASGLSGVPKFVKPKKFVLKHSSQ